MTETRIPRRPASRAHRPALLLAIAAIALALGAGCSAPPGADTLTGTAASRPDATIGARSASGADNAQVSPLASMGPAADVGSVETGARVESAGGPGALPLPSTPLVASPSGGPSGVGLDGSSATSAPAGDPAAQPTPVSPAANLRAPATGPMPTGPDAATAAMPVASDDLADGLGEAGARDANEQAPTPLLGLPSEPHPLQIAWLRARDYPGSDLEIEQTLEPGSNYDRHVASYDSDGLKQFALLTIPRGEKPPSGWPVIVFNHGYISPAQYRTTERYIAYTDAFSRNGYIVIKPDYRGHGSSEGEATGGYGSPDYTVDVLNALASISRHPDADPSRIGMWGHSMGGHITLRAMVVSDQIKAGVIWGGVVAPYTDLWERWHRRSSDNAVATPRWPRRWRDDLVTQFGTPEENPEFWDSLSANSYLEDISGPIQLHHGLDDTSVPVEYSEELHAELQAAGRPSELYLYPGNDHNISASLAQALERSVAFFDEHVKDGG